MSRSELHGPAVCRPRSTEPGLAPMLCTAGRHQAGAGSLSCCAAAHLTRRPARAGSAGPVAAQLESRPARHRRRLRARPGTRTRWPWRAQRGRPLGCVRAAPPGERTLASCECARAASAAPGPAASGPVLAGTEAGAAFPASTRIRAKPNPRRQPALRLWDTIRVKPGELECCEPGRGSSHRRERIDDQVKWWMAEEVPEEAQASLMSKGALRSSS